MEFELKYLVPNHAVDQAIRFIRQRCQADPKYPVAVVSSIYFDDRDLTSLAEKVNSDFYKSKVRVRWYSNLDGSAASPDAFLEIKHKHGAQRDKIRHKLDIQLNMLENVELHDTGLPEKISSRILCLTGLNSRLYPVLEIRYVRHRFIDRMNNCRISVDSDILMPRTNRRMIPSSRPAALQSAVIEVKGRHSVLPTTLQPLLNNGVRKSSFSKYLAGYARCHNMMFDPR